MKYKCTMCNQEIDNPLICPFCGSGSDFIELIEEEGTEETTNSEINEETFDIHDYEEIKENLSPLKEEFSNEEESHDIEETSNYKETLSEVDSESNEEDFKNQSSEYEEENETSSQENSDIEEYVPEANENLDSICEDCNKEVEEKAVIFEEKPSELDSFMKIMGYLYFYDYDKYLEFKKYFDQYLLTKSIELSKDFTKEDYKNFTTDNDFLKRILKGIK